VRSGKGEFSGGTQLGCLLAMTPHATAGAIAVLMTTAPPGARAESHIALLDKQKQVHDIIRHP